MDELIPTINLIKSTDFKVEDVNLNLHKRVAAAIIKGHSTSHNMRESDQGRMVIKTLLCGFALLRTF
jgi:hypothetical protein